MLQQQQCDNKSRELRPRCRLLGVGSCELVTTDRANPIECDSGGGGVAVRQEIEAATNRNEA